MRGARSWCVLGLLASLCVPLPTRGINIQVQFAGGTLFTPTSDATAKAAISAAAADLSAAITSTLSAVPNDIFSSTVGLTTATFNWDADYSHPVTDATISVPNGTLPANTVKIFVNVANLTGADQELGVAGPTLTVLLSGNSTGGNLASDWPTAVTNAANQSEAAYTRGAGPVIGTIADSLTLGSTSASYSVDTGVNFGDLWLDVDTDNSGAKDSNSMLQNFWHFNHTAPVPVGKYDLYSVALHEMMHVLGIGTSDTWDSLVTGTNWNGASVQSLTGGGANLIDPDEGHITEGTMSVRILDGAPQEAAMGPALGDGTRRSLTLLDLAFLRDLNFDTVSLPADYDGDFDVDGADLASWNTWYGVNANADADGDGDSDGADFLVWQRTYTAPLPFASTTSVPEPSTLALLMTVFVCCRRRRK